MDNLRARIKIYETMRGHRGGGGPAVIPVETENVSFLSNIKMIIL